MQDEVAPVHFNAQHFDGHADMLSALKDTNQKWQAISDKFNYLAQEAQTVVADWQAARDAAAWMQALNADMAQFEQLHTQLEQQGIDPNRYPLLLTQQRSLHRELQQIGEYGSTRTDLEAKKQEVFEQFVKNWEALSAKRQDFLTRVLQNNPSVSIEVKPFGEAWDGIEKKIREILHCGDSYVRDIEHLKDIYQSSGDQQIEELKGTIEKIRSGGERRQRWPVRPSSAIVAARVYERLQLMVPHR